MHKLFACCLVLSASLFMGWPQDHGAGGVGGDDESHGNPGVVGPGNTVAPSVYDDATACWSFNDPSDLGNDDCADTYDLTLVNTPTATGGALGYSADFLQSSSQYAGVATNSSLNPGSGVSWGFAGWSRLESAGVVVPLAKGDAAAATEGMFDSYANAGTFTCRFHDGTSLKSDAAGAWVNGSRAFFMCRHNATSNELEGGMNATWSGSPTATSGDGAATAVDFTVGAQAGAGNTFEGSIGPVWWYRSASGGDALSDAIATSLYNSGRGKTCADTTETTNLVSCWDMSEDGGPYVDSIGSNNLTAVNTPTQAAGLVERGDSGMGVNLIAASSQSFSNAALVPSSGSFTLSLWFFAPDTGAYRGLAASDNGGAARNWSLASNNGDLHAWIFPNGASFQASVGPLTGEWHMATFWYDSAEATPKCYLQLDDGTVASLAVSGGTLNANSTPLTVGVQQAAYWNGQEDNVTVWAKVLSEDERATLYNSGAGDFYSAYWDAIFNDGIRFAWSTAPETRRIYIR